MIDKRTNNEKMKERLSVKTLEQSFQRDMVNGFGLAPFNAKGVLNLVKESYLPHLWGKERPVGIGQARILAVSQKEPAGKPIKECELVPITLTISHAEEDEEVRVKYGQSNYRRMKIIRMLEEACEQESYLTEEDLSGLMNVSVRTIKRDVSQLRKAKYYLPLRGQQKDIGPGVSHKAQAVERYLRREPVSYIARCMKHSPAAVVRYIKSFARVLVAKSKGLEKEEMSFMLGLSKRLIQEYLDLAEKNQSRQYRERMSEIVSFVEKEALNKVKKRRRPHDERNIWESIFWASESQRIYTSVGTIFEQRISPVGWSTDQTIVS